MSAKNLQHEAKLAASHLVFPDLLLCACILHLPGFSLLSKQTSNEISPSLQLCFL